MCYHNVSPTHTPKNIREIVPVLFLLLLFFFDWVHSLVVSLTANKNAIFDRGKSWINKKTFVRTFIFPLLSRILVVSSNSSDIEEWNGNGKISRLQPGIPHLSSTILICSALQLVFPRVQVACCWRVTCTRAPCWHTIATSFVSSALLIY